MCKKLLAYLAESFDTQTIDRYQGDELYVRACVFESSGKFAFTQPYYLNIKTR